LAALSRPLRAATAPASVLGDEIDLGRWLHPVPVAGVFEDSDWCIWCGSAVRGDDGNYRLFYSRRPSRLGRLARVTHSEVARAACASPTGPYRHAGVVLPACGEKSRDGSRTRNPNIFRVGKKLCLYHMRNVGDGIVPAKRLKRIHRNHQRIGVATADSPAGPWTRFDHPAVDISADRDASDVLMTLNPVTCVRFDG